MKSIMPTGPKLDLVDGEAKSSVRANADKIMKSWLEGFEKALKQEPLDLDGLFIEESWMKDALALSWDLRTLQGRSKITQYVRDHGGRNGLFNLKIPQTSSLRPTLREIGPMTWLESAFDFETKVGQGRGVLRLANTALGEWKAWILFVKLTELRGDPRRYGLNRARYRNQQPLVPQEADDKTQPVVVVIGGGKHRSISFLAKDITPNSPYRSLWSSSCGLSPRPRHLDPHYRSRATCRGFMEETIQGMFATVDLCIVYPDDRSASQRIALTGPTPCRSWNSLPIGQCSQTRTS